MAQTKTLTSPEASPCPPQASSWPEAVCSDGWVEQQKACLCCGEKSCFKAQTPTLLVCYFPGCEHTAHTENISFFTGRGIDKVTREYGKGEMLSYYELNFLEISTSVFPKQWQFGTDSQSTGFSNYCPTI